MLCKLVVGLQMQNRKTTDKINEISIVPNPPNYSIVAIADQRALHLHFATDNQLAKPCISHPSCDAPAFYVCPSIKKQPVHGYIAASYELRR